MNTKNILKVFLLFHLTTCLIHSEEWSKVDFVTKRTYEIRLEKFDAPVVFEWGELITPKEPRIEAWASLFRLRDRRFMVDNDIPQDVFWEKYVDQFAESYFDDPDKTKSYFMDEAQSISMDEYMEEYPQYRYTSVYAVISVRYGQREWAYVVFQSSGDDYLKYFPKEYLNINPPMASAIFLERANSGDFIHARASNKNLPVFVRNLNYRYLAEVEKMAESGYAFFAEDEAHIESFNPEGVYQRMREN